MTDPKISIVLPIYNQADHIAGLLVEYSRALDAFGFGYELLPVINGVRRDDSLSVCQSIQEKYPTVRTLCIDEGGWGRAVRHGLAEARGEILCYTNSARTSPQDLCMFVIYGIAHTEVVIKANRKIRDHVMRRFGSLLYNLQCRAQFDLPCWDINGTPKVFSRKFEKLLQLTSNGDLIDLEFNVVCQRAGYRMLEVPILQPYRHGGKSTTNVRSAMRMYAGAWAFHRQLER